MGLRGLRGAARQRRSARSGRAGTSGRDGCPNGETAAEVGARVDGLVAELRGLEGDAALFAHGHLLRTIGARWVDLPPEEGGRLALGTAALCVLGWEREVPVIHVWNDTSHLAS